MTQKKKSPLKAKPLRYPGQSLDDQRQDLVYDKVLTPFMVAWFVIIFAGLEWWRFFRPSPPNPILFSIFAGFALVWAAWQIFRAWPIIQRLKQASEGEKAVGQFLEKLRGKGYEVFHDIIGQGFNLDHVVIGPAGIFTVETKTISKPAKGEARIQFDGEKLTIGGFEPDRDPVIQAKAQAKWLAELLNESTGRKVSAWPVVVFPGWFIEQSSGSTRNIWVLEPKALPTFLENQPVLLTPEDIKLCSFHLSRFIREQQKVGGS